MDKKMENINDIQERAKVCIGQLVEIILDNYRARMAFAGAPEQTERNLAVSRLEVIAAFAPGLTGESATALSGAARDWRAHGIEPSLNIDVLRERAKRVAAASQSESNCTTPQQTSPMGAGFGLTESISIQDILSQGVKRTSRTEYLINGRRAGFVWWVASDDRAVSAVEHAFGLYDQIKNTTSFLSLGDEPVIHPGNLNKTELIDFLRKAFHLLNVDFARADEIIDGYNEYTNEVSASKKEYKVFSEKYFTKPASLYDFHMFSELDES